MKAFVFPGQGSQSPGMGRSLYQDFEEARRIFEEADDTLGFSLSRLCFEGPQKELTLTENTQPAILTASVAAFMVLEKHGCLPEVVAGHSLGEYSALVAAGSLAFSDAVQLVRQRGRFMQEAVPVGQGAMAAVLGLERDVVMAACRAATEGEVVAPANLNSPGQVVIAGHAGAVLRACRLCEEKGARRCLPLPVSAPFHSELMRPAQQQLRPLLEEKAFSRLRFPLFNNVDARKIEEGAEARDGLIRQVTGAVLWEDSVRAMIDFGVSEVVEVGPGRVLSGLVKKIHPQTRTRHFEGSDQLETVCSS